MTDISVPCSSCLVLLAGVNCSLVVDECMSLFPAGQLPHYYIVKTLADVAANHPVDFVQKLKEVMARMTPVIGNIKKSPMKWSAAQRAERQKKHNDSYFDQCADDAQRMSTAITAGSHTADQSDWLRTGEGTGDSVVRRS